MNKKEVENPNEDNHEVQKVNLVGDENVDKMGNMGKKEDGSNHSESEKVEQRCENESNNK